MFEEKTGNNSKTNILHSTSAESGDKLRRKKMCTLPQKVILLEERVSRDLNHDSTLTDKLCEGVVKYLSIKKLQEIYSETGNETAFEGLKSIFSIFYDLKEVRNSISRIRLNELLGRRNIQIGNNNVRESLNNALHELALTDADNEYNGRGRTWCVHLVFASKVLHTFNNDLPIVDSFVKGFFNLDYDRYNGATQFIDRCNHVSNCYDGLIGYYDRMEEYDLDLLADLFSQIMNNRLAFDAEEHIGNYANTQNSIFDSIRADNNLLNTVVEYAGNIETINNDITTVKKIDFMIWNYWRTIYKRINAPDLPGDVALIQGERQDVINAFEQMRGQNLVSAVDIRNKSSAKSYVRKHSEKFYKIFWVI